jgi:hypothetical protein
MVRHIRRRPSATIVQVLGQSAPRRVEAGGPSGSLAAPSNPASNRKPLAGAGLAKPEWTPQDLARTRPRRTAGGEVNRPAWTGTSKEL